MELRKFPSNLGVIVLSIVFITGMSLLPTLQIGVDGQARQQRSLTPATPPTPVIPQTSTATTSFTTPQPRPAPPDTTTTTTPEPPVTITATTRITPAPTDTTTTTTTDAADGAANQSAVVMIPLSTIQMIMSQVQDAMTAVDSGNEDDAMTALNSVDQELKSAVDASSVSVETQQTDDGGASEDNE